MVGAVLAAGVEGSDGLELPPPQELSVSVININRILPRICIIIPTTTCQMVDDSYLLFVICYLLSN